MTNTLHINYSSVWILHSDGAKIGPWLHQCIRIRSFYFPNNTYIKCFGKCFPPCPQFSSGSSPQFLLPYIKITSDKIYHYEALPIVTLAQIKAECYLICKIYSERLMHQARCLPDLRPGQIFPLSSIWCIAM